VGWISEVIVLSKGVWIVPSTKGDRPSNPTGGPAAISKINYLGQVSYIWSEDSEFLCMRKAMAL
jgi:hypothetical protein